ncbi:disks large-associated protein 5-like [Cydia amplana]|uniref:disks large-associated protein 5-like n=1 Tax=Cydia amplana TaxID=1869771 RepID=UPI002FE5C114
MDTSFDLVALLKQQPTTKKSYKIRPTQFVSVAGGVQKRLETNIKDRKSSRLSVLDRNRSITKCKSPKAPKLSDAQQKALHRKQLLENWKEEKDKKKKEAASQKKKPFVAGVSQRRTFGPPPPPPEPMPSTSGRVTRSQARQNTESMPNAQTNTFAPSNAAFKPVLKKVEIFFKTKVPTLAPINKKKASKSKSNITFEPVLRKNLQKETKTTRSTRARPVANKPVIDNKKKLTEKTKANPVKPPLKQQMFQSSSSSSDMEQPSKQSKPSQRKSITKTRETVPMAQASTSQDSACDLQDNASMSSQDSQVSSQDSQVSSQDSQDAVMSQASMSSQDELSTPRNKVPKSESSSEEKLRSPKAVDMPQTPEQVSEAVKNISPCVTMSRGKDNARKEMKKKLEEGLLDEDNSNMESVNHFRRQLNSEMVRITAMCETWDQIFAQTVLPEPIQELVLTAVGQARLLMSQKLQQFAGLLESCARPTPGAAPVTPADLHGFWDMVFMQVENVDMRFKSLEELRLRDWIEEQKPVAKRVVAKPVAKKVVAKPTGGPSRLREMIAAARKAKKDQESQSENSESEKSEPTASPETKTFEAGFFRISSPMKLGSPAPGTPNNKASLLKTVLSSEAKKSVSKNCMSFAMLRASLMSKNLDIEGVSPLMQTPTITVNLDATPARSILKQNPVSNKKPDKLKTVLFRDDPSSPTSCTSCDKTEAEDPGVAPLPADDKENTATTKQTSARKSSCDKTEAEDPGVAPLPADDKENTATPKQTSARKSRLSRQNAEEQSSPVTTRSRRKSPQTPLAETEVQTKRGTRKSAQTPLAETEVQPKHSTWKSAQTPQEETEIQTKRGTRKSAQTPQEETEIQPKRSTRKSAQTPLADTEVQPKRKTRKSAQTPLVESDTNVEKKRSTRKKDAQAQETETPKRSTRRRKSAVAV